MTACDSDGGLVLVIPKVGSEVAEHFAHTVRLADYVSREIRTAVIAERVVGAPPRPANSIDLHIQQHADSGAIPRAWELFRMARGLRRAGFDSFFVRTSQTAAVPIILLCRVLGGRVMYWNCGERRKSRLRDVGLRAAFRSEIPVRLAFRWADTVVTGTESLAAHYARTDGIARHRLAVLPNEIDLEWFRPPSAEERLSARAALGAADDEQLVLSVHRFSPVRRTLLYVPQVLQAVLQRHPMVRFIFAGGGPEESEVRRAVASARVDDRVRMLGAVPHDDVRQLYAAADVFMMPSYTEGFPRVLLEAMAMRVPIASTDVGGVREILPTGYGARLANRSRPLELANAIDELLDESEVARQLVDEGSQWVQQFDAPRVARRLVDLARS